MREMQSSIRSATQAKQKKNGISNIQMGSAISGCMPNRQEVAGWLQMIQASWLPDEGSGSVHVSEGDEMD